MNDPLVNLRGAYAGEKDGDEEPRSFSEVLSWETNAINNSRPRELKSEKPAMIGLALSGGGIRSATFNLGVIQTLSELKLLRMFDYLSTVSGGGYIGAWLSALIHREHQEIAKTHKDAKRIDALLSVEGRLAGKSGKDANGGEALGNLLAQKPGEAVSRRKAAEDSAVSFLRDYSNYLTPRLGIFSADTLTMVTTALRNIYLNLTILVASFSALLLLPKLLVKFDLWVKSSVPQSALILLGAVFVIVCLVVIWANLIRERFEQTPWWSREAGIVVFAGGFAFIGAHFFNLAFWKAPLECWLALGPLTGFFEDKLLACWLASGAVMYTLPWVIGGALGIFFKLRPTGSRQSLLGNLAAVVAAGMFGGWLLYLHATETLPWFQRVNDDVWAQGEVVLIAQDSSDPWLVTGFGTPIMVQILALAVILHVGLAGRLMPEGNREWIQRLGAWLLALSLLWFGIFALLMYAVPAIKAIDNRLIEAGGITGWAIATGAGAFFGRSPKTGPLDTRGWRDHLAVAAPYIFIVGLLGLLAWGLHEVLQIFVTGKMSCVPMFDSFAAFAAAEACEMNQVSPGLLAGAIFLCAAVGFVLSWRVDINLFSLHHFYRNRLTRCYLGASKFPDRRPQPFTGFDPDDDLALSALVTSEDEAQRPYPIVNTALNLVHGADLGWQQRKAASFVFTPRYCGFELAVKEGRRSTGCFRPSKAYIDEKNGVSFGSAMAISGAAASPNMGYHSSAPVAFLMTVFNVRLGRWCGNPCKDKWRQSGPTWGLSYLLKEVFARTDEKSRFVYLSDGGHFENLGIYELVRRGCRLIVASDAGCDEKFVFQDLANAIRKCYADFGIGIDVDVGLIRGEENKSAWHCAVGTIHYRDQAPGTLIYIKPSLLGNEPTDVFSYAASDRRFPHQPTSDQWFEETQFESYRKLGYHIARAVFEKAVGIAAEKDAKVINPEALANALHQLWYPPSKAPQDCFAKHSKTLTEIYERVRSNPSLEFLDAQMYPEWQSLTKKNQEHGLPKKPDDWRSGFYLCHSLLQLMENVYLDLKLDENHAHPDNRGWMNLFKHWSGSAMLAATWAVSAATFGARFQSFCRRELGLDVGEIEIDETSLENARKALNFLEQTLLDEFINYNQLGTVASVIVISLAVKDPVTLKNIAAFTVGFAIVQNEINRRRIVYFRIQDHLRRMGLARRALAKIIASGRALELEFLPMPLDSREPVTEEAKAEFAGLFLRVKEEHEASERAARHT